MRREWYIEEYEEKIYLHDKILLPLQYHGESEDDHEHCELCWAKISKYSDDFQEGYYEPLSKSWICPDCYRDFSHLFGWTK